ncbi:PhzF family phenazine biosynthesis protein [Agaribacterium haliotis]|uniref:PhzF family phenazine biosynthesis protein n=1 Tax=Agaribacterium haliotis TaxID=2013869 RepID=UPI000BB573EF|nr:PhzF family phenazine biosynthesis protein [Agaribacterium haliotis]
MSGVVYRAVNAFAGPGCRGRRHRVIEAQTAIDSDFYLSYSLQVSPDIVVVLPAGFSAAEPVLLRIFHNGREVLFCGSGAMSAGFYCMQNLANACLEFELPAKSLSIEKRDGALMMHGRAELAEQKVDTDYWQALLGQELLRCTAINGGYLIAEIASAEVLKHLTPDLDRLRAETTAPALIVTALGAQSMQEDYAMRYFAPQYGNDEDAATASANLYLMKYWQGKLNKTELRGRQLSPEGAVFSASVCGDTVSLSGDVCFA